MRHSGVHGLRGLHGLLASSEKLAKKETKINILNLEYLYVVTTKKDSMQTNKQTIPAPILISKQALGAYWTYCQYIAKTTSNKMLDNKIAKAKLHPKFSGQAYGMIYLKIKALHPDWNTSKLRSATLDMFITPTSTP